MKILIEDDHELYRDALSILVKRLDNEVDIQVAKNYTDLLSVATEGSKWDEILIDINMPDLGYFEGISQLTKQQDVFNLMCLGSSNKRITLNLNLSVKTVKLHVRAILQALNVENRTQAVIIAKPLLSSNTPVSD